MQNPQYKWNYNCLHFNNNINPSIIIKNPEINWNYYFLSRNEMSEPYQNNEYNSKFSHARQEDTLIFINHIKDELTSITWQYHRVIDWCFDNDQKDNIKKFNIGNADILLKC